MAYSLVQGSTILCAITPQLSRDSVMFVNTVIVAMINSIKWIFVCTKVV